MAEENKTIDYMSSINKARRRRKRPPYGMYAAIAAGCLVLIGGICFGGKALLDNREKEPVAVEEPLNASANDMTNESDTAAAEVGEDKIKIPPFIQNYSSKKK